MRSRQYQNLLKHRQGLAFCLRFSLYTVTIFLALYALHVPVGRNVPCPCGSGLKAKRCCGG